MRKKVIFKIEEPVISCGVNVERNFLNSEDYICGAVLRAGFAKKLCLENNIPDGERRYWVRPCEGMDERTRAICEKFSDMRFSFLYLNGAVPAPMTAKKCKLNAKHPIKDIMLCDGIAQCAVCRAENPRSGRMEDVKGYISSDDFGIVKALRSSSTHTAINYTSRIALNGSLYSTRAIARGQELWGYIDDLDTGLIEVGTVVYVGKYSSNGYGKLKAISVEPAEDSEDLITKITEFNEKYGKKTEGRLFIPILLLSDARLGITEHLDAEPTDSYKRKWREYLFGGSDMFEVESVYAQNRIYRGYDTSKPWGEWEKRPVVQTVKGSSFLVSVPGDSLPEAAEQLAQLQSVGIGADTENGYGQIEICNAIHMLGVNDR